MVYSQQLSYCMLKCVKMIRYSCSEIARFQRYSIRRLTREHREEAIELLAQEFNRKEPLALAYFSLFPEKGRISLQEWRYFWQRFGDEFFVSGLSVGCFDLESQQLIGTLLGKDVKAVPQEYYATLQESNFKYPITLFGKQLYGALTQTHSQLFSNLSIKTMHLWGGSLRDEHMGRRLLHKMMYCNEYLGYLQNYHYAFSWASNLKSGVAFKKLNYAKISEVNAKEFEVNGVRFFDRIDEQQKYQSLWMKTLEGFQGKTLPLTL